MRTLKTTLGLLLGFFISVQFATAQTPEFQLVQSVPIETNLAHPSLPYAKDVWVEMIRNAKNSIDLAQFYLSSEPSAPTNSAMEAVLTEMEKAAARGVKFRVIVSNALLSDDPATLERVKKIKNLELRILDLSKTTKGILHAKYWIVDDREAFIGSQNFDWRALVHIHETGVLVRDAKIIQSFRSIFNNDWALAAGNTHFVSRFDESPSAVSSTELVASPPELNPNGIRSAEPALLELLNGAKKSIQVQLLSYSVVRGKKYWSVLDQALRAASVRGVQVQLMVAHWSLKEPTLSHLKSLDALPNIEVKMSTIPTHSSGEIPYARVIHSKLLVIDGETLWIGTSNWSEDYFQNSRNLELILRKQPELAQKGQEIFQKLWNSGYSETVARLSAPAPKEE